MSHDAEREALRAGRPRASELETDVARPDSQQRFVRRFMKQHETISAALSDASAVLKENSYTEAVKVPSLTIMTPHRVGYPEQKDDPPMSVKLHESEVRALYDFLHGYYSANDKAQRQPPSAASERKGNDE